MRNKKRPARRRYPPSRRSLFIIMQEISHSDFSGITTKAPCEAARMGERHVRIEISDFVMRTFVLVKLVLCHRVESETVDRKQNR